MTKQESNKWFDKNQDHIRDWRMDFDSREGYCVATYKMKEGDQVVHHIKLEKDTLDSSDIEDAIILEEYPNEMTQARPLTAEECEVLRTRSI